MNLPLDELIRRVVDRLNSGKIADHRGGLVTQTVAATVLELQEEGFLETEKIDD